MAWSNSLLLVVHGGAIHLLDLIWWLSGKKILRVYSIGNNLATENTKYKRKSLAATLLELDDGSTAKVSANLPVWRRTITVIRLWY